jgi:hypothetical protein
MGTWGDGDLGCSAAVQSCDPSDPVLCIEFSLIITIHCPCLTMTSQCLTIVDQSILKYVPLAVQQAPTCQQTCT